MALGSLIVTMIVVYLGYRFYATRVDRDIIQADPKRATPAKMYNDGVDFMPASASVLSYRKFRIGCVVFFMACSCTMPKRFSGENGLI